VRQHRGMLALVVVATVFSAALRAQEQPAPSRSRPSRCRSSSRDIRATEDQQPALFAVGRTRQEDELRMGAEVPVVTMTVPTATARGEKRRQQPPPSVTDASGR
jgi:hypothetical protein